MMIHVPMFHCFGMVLAMTAAMTHGSTMSPIPFFSPKQSLECINREKITCFHGVPTMFISMLEHEDFAITDFSHMRTGIMAGSPCPVKTMQDVVDKMNMTEITIVFGQTEASPGCTQSRADDSIELRVNTVGAVAGCRCWWSTPRPTSLSRRGERAICREGLQHNEGLITNAAGTALPSTRTVAHTGDLATRDENGYFKSSAGIKDMIIRGGENIYPRR